MLDQNNTGITWTGEHDQYFLRDDQALGICDRECYSLFRRCPDYGRVLVLNGTVKWAIHTAHMNVIHDREEWGLKGEVEVTGVEG